MRFRNYGQCSDQSERLDVAGAVLAGLDNVMGRTANTLQPQFGHVHTLAATFTQFLRSDTDWSCDVTFAERYRCARVYAEFRTALDAWFTRITCGNHHSDADDERNIGLAFIHSLANHVRDRRLLATLRATFFQAYTCRHLSGQRNAAGEHFRHARDTKPCARGAQPRRI